MKNLSQFLRLSGSIQLLIALLAAVSLALVSGCEKLPLRPDTAGPTASPVTTQEAKGENPFSVAIMRQAYANLLAKQAAGQPGSVQGATTSSAIASNSEASANATNSVQPTHTYLRFRPANTDQLADLGDLGFNLSW